MARALGPVSGHGKQTIAEIKLTTSASTPRDDWGFRIVCEDGVYNAAEELTAPPVYGTRAHDRGFGDIKDRSFTATVDGKKVTATFGEIAALLRVAAYAIVDDEIVAEEAHAKAVALNESRKAEAAAASESATAETSEK